MLALTFAVGSLGNAGVWFLSAVPDKCLLSVSLATMEGATEAKKAGILPLFPFSGWGASPIQTAKPFPWSP